MAGWMSSNFERFVFCVWVFSLVVVVVVVVEDETLEADDGDVGWV